MSDGQRDLLIFIVGFIAMGLSVWAGDRFFNK